MKLLVVEDIADSWGTDHWNYRNILGEFIVDTESIGIIESGPVRTIYQSVHHYNQSKIVINVISYPEFPFLEYRLRIHWNEQLKRLKLSIPTIFKEDPPLCEIIGGSTPLPHDGDEYVHGRWLLLKGKTEKGFLGLAIIHNGLHGFDCLSGEVRLSVLRSAAYCHEQGMKLGKSPVRKYMDQGIHNVRLLIFPGNYPDLIQNVSALADWLNAPPSVFAHLPYGSANKNGKNFFQWDAKNLRLLTCKKSEHGEAIILRFQEVSAKKTKTIFSMKFPSIQIPLKFHPFQIKTIRIEKTGKWKEVDPILEK
jgi:alpha-mannosidase